MAVDPHLERVVRNELARRDRLVGSRLTRESAARALVRSLHAGEHDLLAHLRRAHLDALRPRLIPELGG
jgi:hypothetical protein